jgi:regulator of sigma E protease
MVLVHEFGHFIVAKLCGVRVDVFSLGFGPRLFGLRRGDTDYRVSALPVGGYVKMAGDNPAEDRTGDPAEFLSKPRWQRFFIILAGPTMNFLTAFLLLAGLFTFHAPKLAYQIKPVEIVGVPMDSPAEKAGIRAGDRLVSINGTQNPNWEQAEDAVLAAEKQGSELNMTFEREGQTFPVALSVGHIATGCDQYKSIGFPPDPVVIDQVILGTPAERSGLHAADQVAAVNGQPISSWCQLVDTIQQSMGQPLQMDIRRGDQVKHFQVHPVQGQPNSNLRWQIGVSPRQTVIFGKMPWTEASQHAALVSVRFSQQIIFLVGDLFRGRVSLKQVSGPLGIMQLSGQAAQRGIADVINVMALIGINLGILNLLPIPILDGGHILMLAIESTIRRDLSVKIKERFVYVGLVFLLMVFAVVMYNDVLKMLPGR